MNIIRTQWKGGGSGKHTHTEPLIHRVGGVLDAILTHGGVAKPLITLGGYEYY